MNGFFTRLLARFRQFMQGRYGVDNLSRFIMAVALILWVVNTFLGYKIKVISILVAVLLILVYWRMLSRNIQARYNENTRYLSLKNKVLGFFGGKNKGANGSVAAGSSAGSRTDAGFKVFACPACRQRARVPSGKGKIEITCPKCGNHFKRRT